MELDQALRKLGQVTDQRDRYRDALLRIICARSIRDARRIVSAVFKEETLCHTPPVGAGLIPPSKPPSRPPA